LEGNVGVVAFSEPAILTMLFEEALCMKNLIVGLVPVVEICQVVSGQACPLLLTEIFVGQQVVLVKLRATVLLPTVAVTLTALPSAPSISGSPIAAAVLVLIPVSTTIPMSTAIFSFVTYIFIVTSRLLVISAALVVVDVSSATSVVVATLTSDPTRRSRPTCTLEVVTSS
jgi:hypothetical protein